MGQSGTEVQKKLNIGDAIRVKVLNIDSKTRKIALTLQSQDEPQDAAEIEKYLTTESRTANWATCCESPRGTRQDQ